MEGEARREGHEGASDLSIIEVLHPQASRYTFLAMGGRSQVVAAVSRLQAGLPPVEYGVAVVGLVDSDRSSAASDSVIGWPVCEFENLLLDPNCIVEAVRGIDSSISIAPEDIAARLQTIAIQQRDNEIRLRVSSQLKPIVVRPSGLTVTEIRESVDSKLSDATASLGVANLEGIIETAVSQVDALLADDSYLDKFKGKNLLQELYRTCPFTNVSYEQFCYAVAQCCKSSPRTMGRVNAAFTALDSAVDRQLEATVLK